MIRILILILLLIPICGCRWLSVLHTSTPNSPVVFEQTPGQQAFIQAINANTANVQQLDAHVRVSIEGVPARLAGTLNVERPNRLRLKVGLLGMSDVGVDVGSNEDRFWIWSKFNGAGEEPTIYFANHNEFAASPARNLIPLEPQWIIDALGLVQLDPNATYQGPTPRGDGRLELKMTMNTASGPMMKVIVVDAKYGFVMQQSVYDAQGRLVAYSDAIKHQYFEEHNANLPTQIDLYVYGPDNQPTKLTLTASDYKINELYGDPDRLWTMPTPRDVKTVDLTKVSVPPSTAFRQGPPSSTY